MKAKGYAQFVGAFADAVKKRTPLQRILTVLTLPENARIIVVGASGAIGRALIEHLRQHYP